MGFFVFIHYIKGVISYIKGIISLNESNYQQMKAIIKS